MLDRLQQIALRLAFLKPVFALLTAGALVMLCWAVFLSADTDLYLIPSAIVLLWGIVGFNALTLLPSVPTAAPADAGLLRRIRIALVRGLYYLLVIALLVLTVGGLNMTLKLLGIWSEL
ncbi:MAG: hypothetical protein ACFHX7_20130 [Pseudomonadota bacterium]